MVTVFKGRRYDPKCGHCGTPRAVFVRALVSRGASADDIRRVYRVTIKRAEQIIASALEPRAGCANS
jgi:hypothetical protein